jgi:hypothetical protein
LTGCELRQADGVIIAQRREVSSVMYRARWTAHSSFCSSSTGPISRIVAARWQGPGGDRGYRPAAGPDAAAAARVRKEGAERAAHRLALELEAVRSDGNTSRAAIARAMMDRGYRPLPAAAIGPTRLFAGCSRAAAT